MKLAKVIITDYGSCKNTEVDINEGITILIGKNGSGKTNIMKAISLIDISKRTKMKAEEIRIGSENRSKIVLNNGNQERLKIVEAFFSLTDIEKKETIDILEEKGILEDSKPELEWLKIDFFYSDIKKIKLITRDNKEILNNYLENIFKNHKQKTINLLKKFIIINKTIYLTDANIIKTLEKYQSNIQKVNPTNFNQLINEIKELSKNIKELFNNLDFFSSHQINPQDLKINHNELMTELKNILSELTNYYRVVYVPLFNYFRNIVPIIHYVSGWNLLQGNITLTELLNNKTHYPTIINLLKLGDISVEQLSNFIRHNNNDAIYLESELKRTMNDLNKVLTEKFKKHYKQKEITFDLDLRRIQNNEYSLFISFKNENGDILSPDQLSKGEQTYLAFYINSGLLENDDSITQILLLDDLGIHMHPKAQKDMLSVLEGLTKNHQIILATHTPFMIDTNKLERVRIIDRDSDHGTIVKNPYEGILDPLSPIRTSIGMELVDSLAFGKNTIVVEGISDKILLDYYIERIFSSTEQERLLKPKVWPAGGAKEVKVLCKFLFFNGLNFKVLLDDDNDGRAVKKELRNELGDNIEVFLVSDLLNVDEGFDYTIENIIPRNVLTKAFLKYVLSKINHNEPIINFNTELEKQIIEEIDKYRQSKRKLVKNLEKLFKKHTGSDFSKKMFMKYLTIILDDIYTTNASNEQEVIELKNEAEMIKETLNKIILFN